MEAMFIEITIRNSKWLLAVGYNPQKIVLLELYKQRVDKHLAKYENIILLGDFNSEVSGIHMENICELYNLKNLIDEHTCFKSIENPSSIDVMLTNRYNKLSK